MYYNIFVLFMFLSAHFIGDYVFQTPYIAEMKKKSLYHLFVHGVIYTWVFIVMSMIMGSPMSLYLAFVIFISHVVMDFWKCQEGHTKKTYIIDQVYHILVVLMLVMVL